MGQRRTDVELCFDSMTDLITNLAGGLILIVLLLLAITRVAPRPAASPGVEGAAHAGERPVRPLLTRLDRLQDDLDRVNGAIANDGNRLKALEQQVAELLKDAAPKTEGEAP